jgi:hypothetical protein
MSKMLRLVQEAHARLSRISKSEQALVQALGDALNRVDQQLLQDVRNLTAEHESRRGAILLELESLAARIGAFPTVREPVAGLAHSQPLSAPIASIKDRQRVSDHAPEPVTAADIEEQIDLYLKAIPRRRTAGSR